MSVSLATGADPDTLVVSGWSAASPYGLGAEAFAAGVLGDVDAVRGADDATDLGPYERAGRVPDFAAKAVLGRKGTRAMDRATALAVATAGLLLEEAGPGLAQDAPEAVGMVLGTGHGSVQSIMDFTRDSLTGDKPFHVDPALFPNTVMNRAAGQSAIWHTLRGPNTTVAGGAATGLLALNYAARLLRQRHCEAVLCGAVEEFSTARAWLEYRARTGGPHRQPAGPLGEGCALFLLESLGRARAHGRTPLASLLAARFIAFTDQERAKDAVARSVTEALKNAEVRPEEVALLVPSDSGGELGAREDAALADLFGEHRPPRLRLRRLTGDLGAASASMQLAAAVAAGGEGTPVLVTSVDPDGQTGAVVLRTGTP
ncbi:3-oxoacyl-ACP synthase [Streptomyces avermitilis]|uniref:3-oxoacyl-ACP synthase I n=2 Tax=Streptomyces avermitilis TaxID=33903 RepID=Q79Z64_STRAW|nr:MULTISPECIES: beta-ketoacyl synthase N-terminal-like domain-containing protein [Streptomyces]KUN56806.1 3-oxoacyl-ACP synthase [Streptomyces avermitilis]MYS99248.1 3-oxoacyl-ACP synthase [Streptomyces sp. SID5469]OOV32465.1 3-oxoacyl-ACP synthase [Streptomyces avermitilis]BAB69264.1 3-oxoacyl-(acyl carrier protein) synthase I [Streptomyces avermitilis]BAC71369.1 putative 3-oxoacyl-ACP synthase I [Streptomyces avermitilis MA-4680 = NBRC 14893]